MLSAVLSAVPSAVMSAMLSAAPSVSTSQITTPICVKYEIVSISFTWYLHNSFEIKAIQYHYEISKQ